MAKPLYQNDPRWKDQKIGSQNSLTIEQVGCMLTCLTMTMNHFGANETPASLNNRMKAAAGFAGAWIKGAQVPAQFPQIGVERQYHVECKGQPAPLALIDQGLAEGSLIMVRVDWTPDANIDSHWVVIHGKKGDDYKIWDPWHKEGAPDTLKARYGFGKKELAAIILEAIWHGQGKFPKVGSSVTQPVGQTQVESKKEVVETAQDNRVMAVKSTVTQLTLRSQPVVNQTNVVKALTPNDLLTVMESYQEGQAKIGKQGQWLRVKDKTGADGYVAAWLVQQAAAPTNITPPPVSPAPPQTTLTVKPTSNSLSFRAQPATSGALIRYLSGSDRLTVVESGNAAAKIGQQGQWLKVKTADGVEGYVAAWFVTKA